METEKFIKKWEKVQSKDMAHYALFNSVITTLAFLCFIVFFHSANGGNVKIFNGFSEYVLGCSGIFAGSAIGSCFGWKVKEIPYQEESIWSAQCIINDKKVI